METSVYRVKQPRGGGQHYVTPARAAAKETSEGEVHLKKSSCLFFVFMARLTKG